MTPRPWIGIAGACVALAVASCAPQPANSLCPVSGTVLCDGAPAAGAVLTFHRIGDPDKTNLPHAVVRSDGTYSLTTLNPRDGAMPGRYQVTVIWRQKNKANRGDDESPFVLPARYLTPELSGIEVEITPGTTQLDPIQLSK